MNCIQRIFVPGDMFPRGIEKWISAISFHEISIKFNFHHEVIIAGFFRFFVDIGMAFAVQHKMADKAEEIGIFPTVLPFFADHRAYSLQKITKRLAVLGATQFVGAAFDKGTIEE